MRRTDAGNRFALRCERCGYLLRGLPRRGNCPECGTPIRHSDAAHRQRLRQRPPEHTSLLFYVAGIYGLINILAGLVSRFELLPIFVVGGPVVICLSVLAAQTINAARPFHWRAVAALMLFLLAAAVASRVALRLA